MSVRLRTTIAGQIYIYMLKEGVPHTEANLAPDITAEDSMHGGGLRTVVGGGRLDAAVLDGALFHHPAE